MTKIFEGIKLRLNNLKTIEEPTYCHNVEAELDGRPWFHDIKMFLKLGAYPTSANSIDKRTLGN